MKMKNKLGTRQLPTAELLLDGCQAQLISDEGRGIASITNMLTITRWEDLGKSCESAVGQPLRKVRKMSQPLSRLSICSIVLTPHHVLDDLGGDFNDLPSLCILFLIRYCSLMGYQTNNIYCISINKRTIEAKLTIKFSYWRHSVCCPFF